MILSFLLLQVKEITTVSRTAVTASGTEYPALAVTAAATTIPKFDKDATTTNAGPGESLLIMNRNFIKSLEDVADPSCS